MLKENESWTVVNVVNTYFIQEKGTTTVVEEKETLVMNEAHSLIQQGKVGFMAKEQGGVTRQKRGNIRGKGILT